MVLANPHLWTDVFADTRSFASVATDVFHCEKLKASKHPLGKSPRGFCDALGNGTLTNLVRPSIISLVGEIPKHSVFGQHFDE